MGTGAPPIGYIFVGSTDYGWDAAVNLRPGEEDFWDRVPAGKVDEGMPVWILQCGDAAKLGRGFHGTARTIAPRQPQSAFAWLRYEHRFETPILLHENGDPAPNDLPPGDSGVWDDHRLPILLGTRAGNQRARPCGFVGTLFPVSRNDELRVLRLHPMLPKLGQLPRATPP
jgi:hypothetical protein